MAQKAPAPPGSPRGYTPVDQKLKKNSNCACDQESWPTTNHDYYKKDTHELFTHYPRSSFKAIWKSCYRTDWKGPLEVSGPTSELDQTAEGCGQSSFENLQGGDPTASPGPCAEPFFWSNDSSIYLVATPVAAACDCCLLPSRRAVWRGVWLHPARKCSSSQWYK